MTDPTPTNRTGRDLVIEAVIQAGGLGWRTISLSRLSRLADGDETALPLGAPRPAAEEAARP
ncbi:hypothetical protein [Streptomyces collinus]